MLLFHFSLLYYCCSFANNFDEFIRLWNITGRYGEMPLKLLYVPKSLQMVKSGVAG